YEELRGDIFIGMVVSRQFEGDAHKVERIHRHPRGAVGLVDETAGGQWCATIKTADVVESKKTSLENIPALRIFAIHPPGEVEHELVEDAFKKNQITGIIRVLDTALFAIHLEDPPGGPRVDGRVHVAE